jgi:hypothetical protein
MGGQIMPCLFWERITKEANNIMAEKIHKLGKIVIIFTYKPLYTANLF